MSNERRLQSAEQPVLDHSIAVPALEKEIQRLRGALENTVSRFEDEMVRAEHTRIELQQALQLEKNTALRSAKAHAQQQARLLAKINQLEQSHKLRLEADKEQTIKQTDGVTRTMTTALVKTQDRVMKLESLLGRAREAIVNKDDVSKANAFVQTMGNTSIQGNHMPGDVIILEDTKSTLYKQRLQYFHELNGTREEVKTALVTVEKMNEMFRQEREAQQRTFFLRLEGLKAQHGAQVAELNESIVLTRRYFSHLVIVLTLKRLLNTQLFASKLSAVGIWKQFTVRARCTETSRNYSLVSREIQSQSEFRHARMHGLIQMLNACRRIEYRRVTLSHTFMSLKTAATIHALEISRLARLVQMVRDRLLRRSLKTWWLWTGRRSQDIARKSIETIERNKYTKRVTSSFLRLRYKLLCETLNHRMESAFHKMRMKALLSKRYYQAVTSIFCRKYHYVVRYTFLRLQRWCCIKKKLGHLVARLDRNNLQGAFSSWVVSTLRIRIYQQGQQIIESRESYERDKATTLEKNVHSIKTISGCLKLCGIYKLHMHKRTSLSFRGWYSTIKSEKQYGENQRTLKINASQGLKKLFQRIAFKRIRVFARTQRGTLLLCRIVGRSYERHAFRCWYRTSMREKRLQFILSRMFQGHLRIGFYKWVMFSVRNNFERVLAHVSVGMREIATVSAARSLNIITHMRILRTKRYAFDRIQYHIDLCRTRSKGRLIATAFTMSQLGKHYVHVKRKVMSHWSKYYVVGYRKLHKLCYSFEKSSLRKCFRQWQSVSESAVEIRRILVSQLSANVDALREEKAVSSRLRFRVTNLDAKIQSLKARELRIIEKKNRWLLQNSVWARWKQFIRSKRWNRRLDFCTDYQRTRMVYQKYFSSWTVFTQAQKLATSDGTISQLVRKSSFRVFKFAERKFDANQLAKRMAWYVWRSRILLLRTQDYARLGCLIADTEVNRLVKFLALRRFQTISSSYKEREKLRSTLLQLDATTSTLFCKHQELVQSSRKVGVSLIATMIIRNHSERLRWAFSRLECNLFASDWIVDSVSVGVPVSVQVPVQSPRSLKTGGSPHSASTPGSRRVTVLSMYEAQEEQQRQLSEQLKKTMDELERMKREHVRFLASEVANEFESNSTLASIINRMGPQRSRKMRVRLDASSDSGSNTDAEAFSESEESSIFSGGDRIEKMLENKIIEYRKYTHI